MMIFCVKFNAFFLGTEEDIAVDGTTDTPDVSIRTNKEDVGKDLRTGDELRLKCMVVGKRCHTPNIRWVFNNATALVHGTDGVSIVRITTNFVLENCPVEALVYQAWRSTGAHHHSVADFLGCSWYLEDLEAFCWP